MLLGIVLLGLFFLLPNTTAQDGDSTHRQAQAQGVNLETCGRAEVPATRVISGSEALLGEWPWQAWLHLQHTGFICGGSLVAPGWVLTAAHCILSDDASKYKVVLGDVDRKKIEGSEQMIDVAMVIKHYTYGNPVPNTNDVTLLKLRDYPTKTDFVNTVCLPQYMDHVEIGKDCFITGWGRSYYPGPTANKLQQADLRVVSNRACSERHMGSKNMRLENGTWRVTETMLCAGDAGKTGKNGCNGDSGGPFVCRNTAGQWVLQGVVSWGDPECSSANHFSVFARVSVLRHWIDKVIARNSS
ncbi:CUB and peptidase domain-containing protein 2 isoform X1 [Nematostella vectensis]|uniref:CUB and peptidase domain-containing protein 2 isoform X1 n=1 Tax=Nematostella vectensis TaxID=45351 RepID=UPI00207721DE|nr:CUB and peptidase domain-containing protein 2 isoform X1 [Nematostella vectensis]